MLFLQSRSYVFYRELGELEVFFITFKFFKRYFFLSTLSRLSLNRVFFFFFINFKNNFFFNISKLSLLTSLVFTSGILMKLNYIFKKSLKKVISFFYIFINFFNSSFNKKYLSFLLFFYKIKPKNLFFLTNYFIKFIKIFFLNLTIVYKYKTLKKKKISFIKKKRKKRLY